MLADAYLDLGEKVEAIKKYKLVHALMPSDEELEAKIDQLDRDLSPAPAGAPDVGAEPEPETRRRRPNPTPDRHRRVQPTRNPSPSLNRALFAHDRRRSVADAVAESPFDDTTPILRTVGDAVRHRRRNPDGRAARRQSRSKSRPATPPRRWRSSIRKGCTSKKRRSPPKCRPCGEEPDADVFAPAAEPEAAPQEEDDLTATTTMADLYVRQGLVDEARKIYQHMLERDPANDELRSKLDALDESAAEAPAAAAAEADAETKKSASPAIPPRFTTTPKSSSSSNG